MTTRSSVAAGTGIATRISAQAARLGPQLAHVCCKLLLVTLPWGPHWPFSRLDIAAPRNGLLNTGFDLADLLFVGMLLGWATTVLCRRDHVHGVAHWTSGALLLFVLASVLAVFGATSQVAAVHFAVRSAGLALLYICLRRTLVAGLITAGTVAWVLAPGLALNSLLAVAQAVHQNPLGLTWLGEPRMLRTTLGTAVVQVHGRALLRAYGVLPHPNVLGGLTAAALPLVIGLFLHADTNDRRTRQGQRRAAHALSEAFLLLCLALMLAAIVVSYSRSAWLGLLVATGYLVAVRSCNRERNDRARYTRRGQAIVLSSCLVLILLLFVNRDAVGVRLQPASNILERVSIQQRLDLADRSMQVIALRPLTGVGGNNFVLAEERFLHLVAPAKLGLLPVHDTYLLAQTELGPLGSLSWLSLMLAPLLDLGLQERKRNSVAPVRGRTGRQAVPRRILLHIPPSELSSGADDGHTGLEPWRALAGASLVVVAVAGLFDFYIWVNQPVATLWIISLAVFTTVPRGLPADSCHAAPRATPLRDPTRGASGT